MSFVPLGTSCFRWRDFRQQQKIPRVFSASSTKKQRPCMKTHVKWPVYWWCLQESLSFFTPTWRLLRVQFAPCCKKDLSSRHATSQMALIRGISKSTTPPVAWSCWRISFSSWTLTYLDIFGPWLLKIPISYHVTTTHKSASAFCQNCKVYLVQGSLQVLIGFQSIWDQHSLAAKNTVALSICEPHISCLRLPWDAKLYLDSCWILSKRDCQAQLFTTVPLCRG